MQSHPSNSPESQYTEDSDALGIDSRDSESTSLRSPGQKQNPKKRPRRKHPKSRRGCGTCKIRHVKCDETKPGCNKCTATGRSCDEYLISSNHLDSEPPIFYPKPAKLPAVKSVVSFSQSRQTINPIILRNDLLDFGGTKSERRSLDFFYSHSAPALAGYFDEEFWTLIIPQIACSTPSLQHAMIALASFHEHYDLKSAGANDCNSPHFRFTIQQYNKAINALKLQQSVDISNTTALLTTCILFICLEFMRGNESQALQHITSGIQILSRHSAHKDLGTFSQTSSIDDVLKETFSRLSLQAALCGRKLPSLQSDSDSSALGQEGRVTPFFTAAEARYSISNIMLSALTYVNSALTLKIKPDTERRASLCVTQQIILGQLVMWKKRMDLLTFSEFDSEIVSKPNLNILLVCHLNATIWTLTAIHPTETAWDSQLPSFTEIITLCRPILSSTDEAHRKGSYSLVGLPRASPKRPVWRHAFTFEMGIIPPLYFTAIKCRDPHVRREAIRLLGLARPRKEGMWDAGSLGKVAERLLEIEEVGLADGRWPMEGQRVHDAQLLDTEFNDGKMVQKVVFLTRSGGFGGEWTFNKENIAW